MKKLILVIGTLLLFQCEKDNLNSLNNVNNGDQSVEKNSRISVNKDSEGFLELGEKITNPYSIPNMEKALQSLKSKNIDTKDIKIKENYLYVRLLPKNEDEFNKINSDREIDIYEYPLDYKIKKQGNKYKDPTLKDSKYTWLYCSVPLTKVFDKNIQIEVLEKLFLPFGNGKEDEYGLTLKSQNKNNEGLLNALEAESIKITGNSSNVSQKSAKISYWQPEGIIKVYDERLQFNSSTKLHSPGSGYIPVPGCLVRANKLFSTYTSLTDSTGYYKFDHSFSNGDVNYSIKWDRADFDIRSGSYGQAYYNGPSQSTGWNLNITEAGTPDNYIYAHVHRAAWRYFYKNTFGVNTPPLANFPGLGGKIHLGAKQGGLASHYFDFNQVFQASEIKLNFDLSQGDPNPEDARYIFNVTIHELTHAAHWKIGMSYSLYVANAGQARRLAESWADGVAWHITRAVYSPAAQPWLEVDNGNQLMSLPMGTYTPLFIDLLDSYNQIVQLSNRPNDEVSGFTISYLQGVLTQRPINWYMYRDYIQANPPANGVTNLAAGIQLFSDYD